MTRSFEDRQYLVRYSEVFLKSDPVRRAWERALTDAIRIRMPDVDVTSERGRIWLSGPVDPDQLRTVFGCASFSPVVSVHLSDLDEAVLAYAAQAEIEKARTYAVRIKRIGTHDFSSRQKEAEIGDLIGGAYPHLRVDLSNPDCRLAIEIRNDRCYLFHTVVRGPGGIPPGVEGTVVALVSGGIDSPVAAYMMMKRGCRVVPIFVALESYLDETALARTEKVLEVLRRYQPDLDLRVIRDDYLQRAKAVIRREGWEKYTCIMCKRRMYRLAAGVAAEVGAKAIVTGESLGQVASQTLDNLLVLDDAATLPVFRPLIGLDKEEIIGIARSIGSFDASITPAKGCQAVPAQVATRGRLEKVRELESLVDRA